MTLINRTFLATICILCLLFATSYRSEAQSKSNSSGIDQATFEILNTRTSILENFNKKDFQRIKVQRDSLRAIYDADNHLAFFPAEYWLLCFWTKDFTNILNDKFLSDTNQYNSTYISYPIFDNMGEEVRKTTREQNQTIKDEITKSNLTQKDKDFLNVVLYYSIHKSNEAKDTLQISINKIANNYISNYSNSQNNDVIKKYIIKEYIGLNSADELLFGGGLTIPSNNLSNYFSTSYNLAIDYRRYFGNLFLGFTANMYSGFLIDSVSINSTFVKKDENYRAYALGLDFGDRIFDGKKVSFSVFGGVGYNALNVTHIVNKTKDKTKDKAEQITIDTYGTRIGFALDFKFVKQGVFASYKSYSDYNHFKFFRLKYDYQIPMFKDNAPELTGGFHNITLSIGFNTRSITKK